MQPITHNNTDFNGTHRAITEASLLGLAPRHWPKSIPSSVGNHEPFDRVDAQGAGPDTVTYRQRWGCLTVVVFND